MRFRILVLFVCGVLLIYASSSLLAGHESYGGCCQDKSDCGIGEECCNPEDIGQLPCDGGVGNAPGYCQQACIPHGQ
jgi:hypothetical protein